ncbi:hypothetical protein CVT25_012030, partial [Psilocybe cyanescens]
CPEFQHFCRQLYHQCLELIFEPLKLCIETYKVIKCPDGHFFWAIFGLGPYIADYPEQGSSLTGSQNECDAPPHDLDSKGSHCCSHEKTDFLIKNFDPGILWDDYGIWNDIVLFTHSFPCANIHELLSPDLLHQLIKGTFKDHLVTWVGDYLVQTHGEQRTLEIIEDIDHWQNLSGAPLFRSLTFSRQLGLQPVDWQQLKSIDEGLAILFVYLAAITGYVPSAMVQCIATFIDACHITHHNAITSPSPQHLKSCVFIDAGVWESISLPQQHALSHYFYSIHLFTSPNGLCSSITESMHIKAVKEPWQRSNRYNALTQMLQSLVQMDKMDVLQQHFTASGMMVGSTSSYMAQMKTGGSDNSLDDNDNGLQVHVDNRLQVDDDDDDDEGPVAGDLTGALSDVILVSRPRIQLLTTALESGYLHYLSTLAAYIGQPQFPFALRQFLFSLDHPDQQIPTKLVNFPPIDGTIKVYHSAMATFYAPSDLCGTGGLHQEQIFLTPFFHGHPR